MIINKESEKHIRNLARCINRSNKPYEKLGYCFTLYELLRVKDLSQAEKDSINFDIAKEVSQLLVELGIDYKDYSFNEYKDWEAVTLYQFNLEEKRNKKKAVISCSPKD